MKKTIKTLLIVIFTLLIATITFAQDESSDSCVVFLNVEFLKTGEVGEISLLSSTCDKDSGLHNKAIKAAKSIKFQPQKKDGKLVTITKRVRYDFNVVEDKVSTSVTDITNVSSNSKNDKSIKKAQRVIQKAINKLGGDAYQNVKTSVGEGKLSVLKSGRIASYSSFTDVIVYPNKERTDLIEQGSKTVLTNIGDNGWFFDESIDKFADQNEIQINNFKQSLRSHYNYLLRGEWRDEAKLSYVGKRRASLGKRNEVLKLTFGDGFEVEYEFAADGLPMKTIYTRMNADKTPIKEENRYAQFILENGILTPFVIDHYTDEEHSFRVNYKSMNYNKNISNEIFEKPDNPKKLTKKLKL